MKSVRIAVLLALMAGVALVALQRGAVAQNSPPNANLKIVSPQNGARITESFVDVRYELTNPATAASPTPTFQLQLDGGDPVQTASTEFTFTGLAPGAHTVIVEAVDANSTPLAGTRHEVRFTVLPQGPKSTAPSSHLTNPAGHAARLQYATYHSASDAADNALPNTGSALPLLSIIGFGVLLGGIASALKTR